MQVALASMTHLIFGVGLMLVLALPWVKTKLNLNLTCYLMGLHDIHKKLGFIPRNFSTFFDRGDENVSKFAVGFWGIMVLEDVVESVLMTSNPVSDSFGVACSPSLVITSFVVAYL